MSFSSYPILVSTVEKKGCTKSEVDKLAKGKFIDKIPREK